MGLTQDIQDRMNSKHFPMTSLVFRDKSDSGTTTVPEGVDARFFRCTLNKLVVEGKSAIYLEDCTIQEFSIKDSSFLAFEGCQLKSLSMDHAYGEINGKKGRGSKDTEIGDLIELRNHSFLDLKYLESKAPRRVMNLYDSEARWFYCKYFDVPEGIYGERSTLRISTSLCRTKQMQLHMKDHSELWVSDSEISSHQRQAIKLESKSVGWVTEYGDGQYPGAIRVLMGAVAVVQVSDSRLLLKDTILKGLTYLDHGIKCTSGGYVECKGVNDANVFIEAGADPGIFCSGEKSKVVVEDYRYIKCSADYAIKCTDHATVICRNVREYILSESIDAIYIEEYGTVEVYGTELINGRGLNAVWAKDHSLFIAANITDRILGAALNGIKLEDSSRAYCNDVYMIRGLALNGVLMDTDCLFEGTSIQHIKGDGLNGIHAKNGSRFYCNTMEKIEGVALHGIQMENDCRGYCRDVQKIHGVAIHGLDMKSGCRFMGVRIDELHGIGTHGINMEDTCVAKMYESKEIIGFGVHGVNMLDHCDLTVDDIDLIKGLGADGIHAEDTCKIYHKQVDMTHGVGDNGILLKTECKLKAYRGGIIKGDATDGVQAEDNCLVSVKEFNEVVGGGRDGFHLKDTNKFSSRKITKVEGARDGIFMEDDCEFSIMNIIDIIAARHGIYGKTEIYGKYERSTKITAGEDGLHFEDQCEVHAIDMEDITGGAHPVFLKLYARLTTHKVTKYVGPETYVEDHSQLHLEECELKCRLKVLKNCIISLTFNKITDITEIEERCTLYLDTWVFEAPFTIKDTCEVDGREVTFKDTVLGETNISLELDHIVFESTVTWTDECRIDGQDHYYKAALTDDTSKYEVSKMKLDSTWTSERSERTVTNLLVAGATVFSDTDADGACRLDHVVMNGNLTMTNGTHRISSFTLKDAIFSGDGYVELSTGTAGKLQATGGKATAHANSCTLGELIATNAGVFINSAAIGTVTLTNCGCNAQNPDVGSMSLANSGLESRAGSIGSCACANSVAEWFGTTGTLTGNSKSIPGASGRVIRYATGELDENFGKHSKRWFDQGLIERIQMDREINIFGADKLYVTGTIEENAGTSHTIKSPVITETHLPTAPTEPSPP